MIKSGTTGRPLPATLIKESKWRKWLHLPHKQYLVVYSGLSGYKSKTVWSRE